jgi:hypothetical protein
MKEVICTSVVINRCNGQAGVENGWVSSEKTLEVIEYASWKGVLDLYNLVENCF